MSRESFESHPETALDEALRSEARRLRVQGPPGLRSRVMARVAASTPPSTPEGSPRPRALAPVLGGLAATAAALLLLLTPWTESEPEPVAPRVARLPGAVQSLFDDVAAPLLAIAQEPTPLEGEAELLWQDTARMAEGVLNDLPRPLRETLLRR